MAQRSDEVPDSPWNVLLVEDCLDIQRLVSLVLKRAGAVVECVDGGAMALDQILGRSSRRQPFDLVLLDLCLPSMHGLDILKVLRTRRYRGKVAILTASTVDVEVCFEAGCDEYITKPFDHSRFVARCLSLISARGIGAA